MNNAKRYGPPDGYYESTKNRPPHELLQEALKHTKESPNKSALDLGCGAGSDTRFLLENGFSVIAVDGSADAEAYIKALPSQEKVRFIKSDFESFDFGSYDLVNASRSLPFTHNDNFEKVFSRVKDSIKPGGLFVSQFYGVNDQWNKPGETMTFLNKGRIEELLKGLRIIKLDEKEYDGTIANGKPKHWHVFNVIAAKDS
jgi:tellurite methyltransferase